MENGIDFDLKYRPAKLDDVIGQPAAVNAIRGFKHFPRALLFHGSPGTGKTSLARIVGRMAGVSDFDYQEINCGGVESAIDMVRSISQQMTAAPMLGSKRMWVLDEAQTFSKSKGAAEALLKVLEDGPDHVMFAICTTDPKRLLPAIRSRCVSIELKTIPGAELESLVTRIAKSEKLNLEPQLIHKIVDTAAGCARDAVKLLQKIAGITDPAERLAAVGGRVGSDIDPFGLVQALLPWKGSPSWKEIASVLTAIKDEEPEGIRMMVLSSARSVLLKGGVNAPLAYRVIMCLSDTLYDKCSGHALLAAGIYQAVHGK